MSNPRFQRRKRTLESRLHARERRGKNAQPLHAIPQGTSAPPATETATPGSGYTDIQDPSRIPSANHHLFETRMPLLYWLDVDQVPQAVCSYCRATVRDRAKFQVNGLKCTDRCNLGMLCKCV